MNGLLTIGLHMTVGDEQTRRQISGVLQYAAEHPELNVRDFCYPGDSPDLAELPPWIGKADGVVAWLPRMPGTVPWLRRARVPVVALGSDLRKDLPSVFTHAGSLARLAVAHFLALGMRHFAYVGLRYSDGSRERCRMLARELAKHGLPLQSYDTEKFLSGTYKDFASLDEVEPELVRLIQRAEKPLAVVAINDRSAAAVCRIAAELGLATPGDVAVLGVGDTELARVSLPPISTIRPALERTGYEAAGMLHRLIRGEQLKRCTVQVSALELVERDSTLGKRRAAATDVDRALEFIRQKASDNLRVEDVAAHVRLPLRTFEIQFAAATGCTVGEEIRNARLHRIKHLLETTDLPLASVAHLAGMNSAAALNEFFRRWTRTTPGKYRRKR
jgi:LacI family transcriptional regulator